MLWDASAIDSYYRRQMRAIRVAPMRDPTQVIRICAVPRLSPAIISMPPTVGLALWRVSSSMTPDGASVTSPLIPATGARFMSAPAVSPAAPYRRTSVFDENTLPAALRREHRTKPGVWGVIRVLEGRLRFRVLDPASEVILEPGHPGLVLPDQPHLVEPLGPMRMQVEFYRQKPDPSRSV
jgi:tellurite resistance-related uncharacterized protein